MKRVRVNLTLLIIFNCVMVDKLQIVKIGNSLRNLIFLKEVCILIALLEGDKAINTSPVWEAY